MDLPLSSGDIGPEAKPKTSEIENNSQKNSDFILPIQKMVVSLHRFLKIIFKYLL
jgi:hypothetical protein